MFPDNEGRQCHLLLLRQALVATGRRLHAYVLMDNRVPLPETPPGRGCASGMMQMPGRSCVGLFNARQGRTGTLRAGAQARARDK
ncbi:hypothetical protein GCM10027084_01180 [Pseudoxanthomonas sangjuensis]|uniref:hypothetical protein n=1 Tax=Pseudoxanthomonas sangjuensis TaxID=1503750 RepID=UPI001FECB268|nr:hypothetical protein [Pseudoxanthomonas sangjuensis]